VNLWPGFWGDIEQAISAAWPAIGKNYRKVVAETVNWVNLVEQAKIKPPYCVIHAQKFAQSVDYNPPGTVTYETDVTLIYIAAQTATLPADLEALMKSMQDYLLTGQPFSTMQVMDVNLATDSSGDDEVTASMLQAGAAFMAASMGFRALVGTIGP
jgi:hypothetical protein